jgi:trimethylamine--corrinoid protein Co-methyltransferase
MSEISTMIQPRINVLSEEQMQLVHERSLKILATVGVRVDSERARRILAQAGIKASDDGERVLIPQELTGWALEAAPSSVQVFDRQGNPAFLLGSAASDVSDERFGEGQTRFGIGVTALYYQDAETDGVVPFARQHMERMVRLGSILPSFDVISTIGIVQDVPPEVSDLFATLDMTANTTKPLAILVSDEARFPDVLDLLEHLHGDLSPRPFVIPYFNPISPLVINQGTVNKMLVAIERGLPFMYSNYGMVGATTPITPAGTLVLLNAELLAGLTLSQLVKEGAPVILGSLPAFFDMKGMGSFYDAQSYLINLACAEMMAFYRLPHCGTSGSGMGWGADLIAGGHQWANHLTSCMGKVGLAPFVGDNLDSKAISPTVIVYANEVIAQARRLACGFPLDDSAMALEEIERVGPGRDYLTSELTLKHFRQAYFRSDVWPNLTLEDWQSRGQPRADDALRAYTQHLLDTLPPPEDHADLVARGEAFIRRLEKR